MSTDSSNPILRRLGVAGVGDERHFTARQRIAHAQGHPMACHPHHPGQYLALCRLSGVRFGGLDIEPLCR